MSSVQQAQLIQRAADAFQRRSFDEAGDLAAQVLGRFGEDANALFILGSIRMGKGDTAGAIAFFERARAAMPQHVHALVSLGGAYRASGRLNEARIVLEEALQTDRKLAPAHNNLGNVLLDLGDRAGAKRCYERAVVAQAGYADPIAGLARIAEEAHDLEEARRLCDRALALVPGHLSALRTRARVAYRTGDAAGAVADLEVLLRNPSLGVTNRIVAEGYLGEALDKLGRFDAAFAAFSRANAQQYTQHAGAFGNDQGLLSPSSIARLEAFVARTEVSTWRAGPPAARSPVFLVGFPRSGTTLLDQILASHPKITTLEERDTLADTALALINGGRGFDFRAALSDGEIEQYRAAYWAQVRTGLSGAPIKDLFIDKLPLNAVFLPLIYLLFPDAKIVFAVRDPRDTVLSCYQQRFGMNEAMFQLLKLDTAARYYDAVMRVVRASRAKLPLALHEVRYEAVVGDFDTTIGALLDFLGVGWDDAVRDYAATARQRAIGTPSASQVVLPLYATASGKWRNYKSFLEPVLPTLAPWVDALGYEAS